MSNPYPPHPHVPTPPPGAGGGTSLDGKRKTLLGCGGMVAVTFVLALVAGACAPDDVVKAKAVPGPTVTATRTVTAPPPVPPPTSPPTSPAPEATERETAPPKPKPEAKPKPKPEAKPRMTPTRDGGGGDVYYKNCTAVRAAGADPIRRGDPGFGPHLDRDGDGVACE
ncbi:excalibur calcium-binding domain-containing protein [Streptomyces sp. NPDC057638]|uniref:excalibur calcium-binding domain-containing protein n=1 Tax=Streptomyces sp. NPDC057638 TaxID=3346190 RepID=UPI0036ABED87